MILIFPMYLYINNFVQPSSGVKTSGVGRSHFVHQNEERSLYSILMDVRATLVEMSNLHVKEDKEKLHS